VGRLWGWAGGAATDGLDPFDFAQDRARPLPIETLNIKPPSTGTAAGPVE